MYVLYDFSSIWLLLLLLLLLLLYYEIINTYDNGKWPEIEMNVVSSN